MFASHQFHIHTKRRLYFVYCFLFVAAGCQGTQHTYVHIHNNINSRDLISLINMRNKRRVFFNWFFFSLPHYVFILMRFLLRAEKIQWIFLIKKMNLHFPCIFDEFYSCWWFIWLTKYLIGCLSSWLIFFFPEILVTKVTINTNNNKLNHTVSANQINFDRNNYWMLEI